MSGNTESTYSLEEANFGRAFEVSQTSPTPAVMVLCEHASNAIPPELNGLGLSAEARSSHVAWDPGALGVAQEMTRQLPAVLVFSTISRLVYDCNRPPDAASAIPEKSERYVIPGNRALDATAKARRIQGAFRPFMQAVKDQIALHRKTLRLLVTVHSFTPVFNGQPRAVELGVLHGKDTRFANAMLGACPSSSTYATELNQPYSAHDGVAFSLDEHGVKNGLLNVMLEIRNDLIETSAAQAAMGTFLAGWVAQTLGMFPTEDALG